MLAFCVLAPTVVESNFSLPLPHVAALRPGSVRAAAAQLPAAGVLYLMKLTLWNVVPFRRPFDGIVNTPCVFEVLALSCFFVRDAKFNT